MKQLSLRFTVGCAGALWLLLGAVMFFGSGCDGERSDPSAMVMQPAEPAPPVEPAPQPATSETDSSEDEGTPVPVYISIDGEPYKFPPARLWLKRTGNHVRARLLSDDPPEALEQGWSGDSFFFEMDMELPPTDVTAAPGGTEVGGDVTAAELASAEWIFRNEGTGRADTRSGIFLGGKSHLQPISVSVLFDPLPDGQTVMVTLIGLFADFDQTRPEEQTPSRQVRVQAALPASAIHP